MHCSKVNLGVAAVLLTSLCAPLFAAESATIRGRLTDGASHALSGAVIVIDPPGSEVTTDSNGHFTFTTLLAGPHKLSARIGTETFPLGEFTTTEGDQPLELSLPVELSFGERIMVQAPARAGEQLSSASASSTVVDRSAIELHAGEPAVAPLLAFTPGVELTRGNLFDFNVNTRGFNSSLNRRMLVRVDGRQPVIPLLGSPEWAALSLEDVESIEVARGGASALYGANAFNGVIDVRSSVLRGNGGGHFRLTGGSMDRRGVDMTVTEPAGASSFVRASGSYFAADDFSRSRNITVEYPGLAKERVPLTRTDDEISHGLVRFDHYFGDAAALQIEGGDAWIAGPTLVAGLGRVQQTDTQRPWARMRYSTGSWSAQLSHDARNADNMLALNSAAHLFEESSKTTLEVLRTFGLPRLSITAGASATRDSVDTRNDAGANTLLSEVVRDDEGSAFAASDYRLTDSLRFSAAANWETSSITGSHLSPRIAAMWSPADGHSLRLSYNRSYQKPNYVELYLRAPLAPPKDLSAIEHALAPLLNGVSLGLESVPVIAAGNEDLDLERLDSLELAWTASLRDTFVTVSAYRNRIDNFITDPIPQLGTTLGRVNPNFGPYVPPAGVSAEAAAAIAGVVPATLSNDAAGRPVLVLYSYANYGEVLSDGLEFSAVRDLGPRIRLEANASFQTFDIRQEIANDPVSPNSPKARYAASASWRGERLHLSAGYRHSNEFRWAAGSFVGVVPAFDVVDLAARMGLTTTMSAAVQVTNALDEVHYEFFGGDLLGRVVSASVQYNW